MHRLRRPARSPPTTVLTARSAAALSQGLTLGHWLLWPWRLRTPRYLQRDDDGAFNRPASLARMARSVRTRAAAARPEDPGGAAAEGTWWRHAYAVFRSPTVVFAALRTDSDEDAAARQEPVLALLLLAGVAGVLASPTTATLLDDPARDGLIVAVFAFLAGGIYAFFGYLIGGGALYYGVRAAGGVGSYRRARHVLAFALAPVALSLVAIWPLRLALYGGDSFRSGGSDGVVANHVFGALELGFAAWSLGLLVVGTRVVERWSWSRAAAAVVAAAAVLAAFVAAWSLLP